MSNILLRELSNADIDWMVTTGARQKMAPDDIVLRPGESLEQLFVLLEGTLSVRLPKIPSAVASQSSVVDSQEIANISQGELFGESWLFKSKSVVWITVAEDATVLTIPKTALLNKLHQDIDFAAHFYRALALLMTEQIRKILEPSQNLPYGSSQVVKEALFVFGELRDSDIDWMVSTGKIKKLEAGEVLLPAGRPTDALYIVLDGRLNAAIPNQPFDPLLMSFSGRESPPVNQSWKIVTYLSRGEVPGITSFLDFQPLPGTYRAETETLVLAIPRQHVAIKLQEDLGFASRLYRVIATQMWNLLQSAKLFRGEGGKEPSELVYEDEDELYLDELQRFSEGGAKFDWMLCQLGVGGR